MLQLVQDAKTGRVQHVEVPTPRCPPGHVLVQTLFSVVSAGTERHTVRVGRQSALRTAASRPDLVDRGLAKLQRDGVAATWRAVQERKQRTTALGYSSSGRVIEVGEGITDISTGDLVACAGAGYASHSEVACVPRQLLCSLPDGASPQQAAFATLGAIALQSVRLASPQLGENVAVIGLGIVGQLAVQLLVANGCRVFAVDLDPDRVELARQAGAVDGCTADLAVGAARPAGQGWDAAIVAADSKSESPLTLAAALCRPKGRVIVVGLVRTDLPRQEFYDKELELTVSRSYGPGRYDPEFELEGRDYPYPYVRWTETRNLEAFVDLVARKRVNVERLISHQYPFGEAAQAYRLLLSRRAQMAILFEYSDQPVQRQTRVEIPAKRKRTATGAGFAFIGAGSFARTTLLPLIKKYGFVPQTIANASVVSARATAVKFGFQTVCSGIEEAIADERVDAVFIATPHAEHSGQVVQALDAGKHVFVEKPLAVTRAGLDEVAAAVTKAQGVLHVGFNRRFSPFATMARQTLADRSEPLRFHYRVNAGPLPETHWLHDPRHGGRIIGEACHFVDLASFLAGSTLVSMNASGSTDIQLQLEFEDGSGGTISYITSNRAPLAKERLELWCGDQVIEMEDFSRAWFYHAGREDKVRWRKARKGLEEEVAAFAQGVEAGVPPIPFEVIAQTTLATIEAGALLPLDRRRRLV